MFELDLIYIEVCKMILPKHVERYGDLPFYIEFSNVKSEPPHYHTELELIFVLQGWLKCKIFHQSYEVHKGEVIFVDTEDLHHIYETSDDVVTINMFIDLTAFEDRYPNINYTIFACEYSPDDTDEVRQKINNKVANLKTILSELMTLTLLKPHDEGIIREKLDELIDVLYTHFQGFYFDNHTYKTLQDKPHTKSADIFIQIFKYVYDNYDERLTLNSISNAVNFSPSYVSHLVKDSCGLTLQELINYLRIEFAEKLMQEKGLTLTQVSSFAGFSSLAYFNKCFEEWHGISPAQYKRMDRPETTVYHAALNHTECIALLQDYMQKPVNPDAYMQKELIEIAESLNKDDLWLLLQVARKLKMT